MSKALPILFNGDMVRAILDGRKTVTRRAVKSIWRLIDHKQILESLNTGRIRCI